MPQLLLELFCEEIPARMQAQAARDLERMARDRLADAGFLPEGVKAFVGPRRLTLVADGLASAQPDRVEERKGPRASAPEQALAGFLRSAGVTRDQLVERDGVLYAVTHKTGRPTQEIIAGMVEGTVRGFPWPKSMTWGAGSLRWVRPLRRILCVFDGETVPFEIDGIASGEATLGHRFMGSRQPFRARTFDQYAAGLHANFVVLDAEERKARILHEARTLAQARNLELVEDPGLLEEVAGLAEWPTPILGHMDPAFLDLPPEVIRTSMRTHQKYFAVRDPAGGALAPHFITVANIEATDGGAAIAAGNARVLSARLNDARFFWDEDRKATLESRLETLKGVTFHAKLGTMHERVQRIEALAREIAPRVGADPDLAAQAARLAKADLGSGMVGEFPELQGIMGGYYARAEGLGEAVADAVRDHYKPVGPSDSVPSAPMSIAVALADKIDTLVGFFAIEEKPTGSRDPYALRRAALGCIRLILENNIRFGLFYVLKLANAALIFTNQPKRGFTSTRAFYDQQYDQEPVVTWNSAPIITWVGHASFESLWADQASFHQMGNPDLGGGDDAQLEQRAVAFEELRRRLNILDELTQSAFARKAFAGIRMADGDGEMNSSIRWLPSLRASLDDRLAGVDEFLIGVLAFFADRLKVLLRDQGRRHDLVDAVFALGDDDLVRIVDRVEALDAFLKTEDGANLLAGYRRATNILRAEEKKAPLPTGPAEAMVDAPAQEQALLSTLQAILPDLRVELEQERFTAALNTLAGLRAPVDAFFEKVLVNVADVAVRQNRLRLLAQVRDAMGQAADFSLIAG